MVDMNPVIPTIGGTTVQEAIENLAGLEGSGFISIGNINADGYGAGVYNVGADGIPTIREAFIEAFADKRLTNGGIILVIAGTYTLNATVEVPPGITIMGEVAGTIINGEMFEQPMFRVLRSSDRPTIGGDVSGSGELALSPGSPIDETRFTNIILVDNLNGNITSGGFVVSGMQTKPMIQADFSSRLVCEGVKFVGRINNGTVTLYRGKTLRGIGFETSGDGASDLLSSHLTVRSCYFDGMGTAIDFSPDNGTLDTLTIDKCKARMFGEDYSGSIPTSAAANSFASFSQCNATLTNNYVLNGGTLISYFVLTAGNSADSDSVFVTITGNTGENFLNPVKVIYYDESGGAFTGSIATKAVITGNNWGSLLNNGWFITVGDNSSIGDGTSGDFNGPGAIDLLMAMNTTSTPLRHEHPVNVFVGEGVYSVTFADDGYTGADRFNFIGTSGATMPRFEFNIGVGASTDEAGHPIFKVGKLLKNINCEAAAGSEIQSVRLTSDAADEGTVLVEHCTFTDMALTMEQVSGSAPIRIVVRSCKFSQTNTYSDSVSIILPNAELVLLDSCIFEGAGYAGLIGEQTGYTNSNPVSSVVLRDCIFDHTGFTIDDASPLADVEAYLVIDGGASNNVLRVDIENCQVMVDNDPTNGPLLPPTASVISASLDTTFLRYVYVRARETHVKNSIFAGPNTTFDVSATNYPLPCLEIVPYNSCHVMDSRFLSNAVSLKIGGNASAFDNGDAVGAFVNNNIFYMATGISQTMLDIEINFSGSWLPSITVSNNNFLHTGQADSELQPYHPIFTNDDAMGTVSIYAEDCDVRVDGNSIHTTLSATGQGAATGVTSLAALVVETTDLGTAVTQSATHITNNHIVAINEHDTAEASNVHTVWVRGMERMVHDNHLVMDNESGISNEHGCLFIENRESASASSVVAPATVSGNIFSRRPIFGGVANDLTFYILIPATAEGDGLVTNNSFCTPTTVSGDNQAYEDNSGTGLQWAVNTNKNQTVQVKMSPMDGNTKVDDVTAGGFSLSEQSAIYSGSDIVYSFSSTSIFFLEDQNNNVIFWWTIPCRMCLPPDVTIIEAEVFVNSSNPDVQDLAYLFIDDLEGVGFDSSGATDPDPGVTLTVTASTQIINDAATTPNISLIWRARTSGLGSEFMDIDDFLITYRW
jgi:hypothetical protein